MKRKFRDISYIIIITFIVVLVSSILFLEFELTKNPEISNLFDAVWWSTVTITSVGYGDSYPVTTEGRIIGIFLMFFSVFLIGAIAGIVSHDFLGKFERKERKKE